MKILLDECIPRKLKYCLPDRENELRFCVSALRLTLYGREW